MELFDLILELSVYFVVEKKSTSSTSTKSLKGMSNNFESPPLAVTGQPKVDIQSGNRPLPN